MAVQKCAFQTVIVLVLFASIEISVAKQIESVFPIQPFDIDGCASTQCLENTTTCRVVHPCDTCEPRIQCIPSDRLGEGIDIECQRQKYQQVLLVGNSTTPRNYSQLKCRGPLRTRGCPKGSVCVDDLRGGGTCCRGRPEPPVEKNGTCPQGGNSVCVGVLCEVDSDCPGAQKCCPGCGMRCKDPVLPPPVCEPTCSPGEACHAIIALDPDTECIIPSCDPVPVCQRIPDPICPTRCGRLQTCEPKLTCDSSRQCTTKHVCVGPLGPFCNKDCSTSETCIIRPSPGPPCQGSDCQFISICVPNYFRP